MKIFDKNYLVNSIAKYVVTNQHTNMSKVKGPAFIAAAFALANKQAVPLDIQFNNCIVKTDIVGFTSTILPTILFRSNLSKK